MKIYKKYVFKKLYRQWVNDELGGFKTWQEAKDYIDTLCRKCHCSLHIKSKI